VPTNDGFRLYDVQRCTPARPDSRQQHPEASIGIRHCRPWALILQHGKLLAQCEVLAGKLTLAASRRPYRSKEDFQPLEHIFRLSGVLEK
jgi:hypothetical protein